MFQGQELNIELQAYCIFLALVLQDGALGSIIGRLCYWVWHGWARFGLAMNVLDYFEMC